jgi:hypothetical protein
MHVTLNVKSPNNISKWQMGFNSAFKGLTLTFDKGGEWLALLPGRLTPDETALSSN